MVDDFNEFVDQKEKWDGRPVNSNIVTAFVNMLDSYGIYDLGFVGPKFTWSNQPL